MIKAPYPVKSRSRDISVLYGVFTGAGAANPTVTTRSDGGAIGKGLSMTRTGVGLYTITLTDGSVPFILFTHVMIVSSTQLWAVEVLTENASTGAITVKLTVGGVATDPANTETIKVKVDASDAGAP